VNEIYKNPCYLTNTMIEDGHLGGTQAMGDPDTWFPEGWAFLVEHFSVKTALDFGCGVGFATDFFDRFLGVKCVGIEGSEVVIKHAKTEHIVRHDFTTSPLFPRYLPNKSVECDLIWSCEFLEHIEETYLPNVLHTIAFSYPSVLAVTAAPPGAGGYHHVNCQPKEYWIEKIGKLGLTFNEKLTNKFSELCPNGSNGRIGEVWQRGGMIFLR